MRAPQEKENTLIPARCRYSFTRFFFALVQAWWRERQDAGAKQFEASTVIHLTLDRFGSTDMAYYSAIAPCFFDRSFHGTQVLTSLITSRRRFVCRAQGIAAFGMRSVKILRGHQSSYGVGSWAVLQPPPRALMRATLAANWRVVMSAWVRSLFNCTVCAVRTSR